MNVRVNPTANLMLAILTVSWAQLPTPKRSVTFLAPTHLSFEKDNSFVVSQSLWMSEITRGMSRYVSELRNVSGRWPGVANVENVARNEESRSRLLKSSDTVHKKHGGKVS